MDRIICVAGPTASGKTALAVQLAKELDGEVVSCDSMQLYRGMDIGTAKPNEYEQQGIVHHMLNVAQPEESYSVSLYVQQADEAVQEILARGKAVVIAGGTGLYMDSLIAGRQFAPFSGTGKRELLERWAQRDGIEAVYDMLMDADPDTAERLHLSDRKRIIRAMEVFLETGKTISWYNEQTKLQPPKYHPVWLGLDFDSRQTLYDRIDHRVDEMLSKGLLDEVKALLADGVPPTATSMQAIGYRELAAYLRGELSMGQAVEQIKQGSRRYAKRQLTWFRRNPEIHWLLREGEEDIFPKAIQIVHGSTECDK